MRTLVRTGPLAAPPAETAAEETRVPTQAPGEEVPAAEQAALELPAQVALELPAQVALRAGAVRRAMQAAEARLVATVEEWTRLATEVPAEERAARPKGAEVLVWPMEGWMRPVTQMQVRPTRTAGLC